MIKQLIILSSLAGLLACSGTADSPEGAVKKAEGVDVFYVDFGPLQNSIVVSGSLLPNEEVDIRSEVAGRIDQLNFSEGSRVAKGKLILKIDDAEWRAQLAKAKSQLDLAEKDKQRKGKLLEAKGLSQEEYDQSLSRVQELQAEVQLIQSRIRNAEIYAPFSGQIGLRYVSPGAYVSQGQILAKLVQTDPIKIEFGVPQRYAGYIKEGMEINFKMDGSDSTFVAKIYAYEARIDAATRTLNVRARCENSQGLLIPGAFAEVNLVLADLTDALMIPTSAVVPQIRGQKVFIMKNGVAQSVDVESGIRTETEIQITKGLAKGDTLITTALLALKDGMPVQVRNVTNAKQ
jgi:membrane fusion protein (multidrug efflux system)